MANRQQRWDKKVDILAGMKGASYEQVRKRAINQMNLSGDEWVRMKQQLGIMKRDVKTPKKKE